MVEGRLDLISGYLFNQSQVKELLQQYSAYNVWANQRIIDCINLLPDEMHLRELPNSYPSLHATLLHIWDAGSIWWQRIKMQEVIIPPSKNFQGSIGDVGNGLLNQDRLWEEWISNASPGAIEHVFHYQNTKREQFRQPVYQVLLQVFNHSTYHRGQLVTMLRQLHVETIPPTDFILWSRRKK